MPSLAIKHKKTSIIISISSDIGHALAIRWLQKGDKIIGTYRTLSNEIKQLENEGIDIVKCDLSSSGSVDSACAEIISKIDSWDNLIIASGLLSPIGPFINSDFEQWSESILVNFTSQLRVVHHLLPCRNQQNPMGPIVLFFAGGGTNNATLNYSAYTVSKIGLIKMCELLDAEIPDTRFSIIGPGWVKTKIHEITINNQNNAGSNFNETIRRYKDDDFVPMQKVLDFCDWIVNAPGKIISGRNFSAANDDWGGKFLSEQLMIDKNMYKLRRFGNDFKKGRNNEKI